MTTTEKFDSIVSRHHADPTEGDRTCRACGRPWPCDVQEIASTLQRDGANRSHGVRSQRSSRRAVVRETLAV